MLTDGFHHFVEVVHIAVNELELAGSFVNHFAIEEFGNGVVKTGKHRVKAQKTQPLIYTENGTQSSVTSSHGQLALGLLGTLSYHNGSLPDCSPSAD